jgi:hypothetical protein
MIMLVLLVAVIGLLSYGFRSWARRRGLADAPARERGKHEPGKADAGYRSLLTEAVAYLGAILVLAGGVSAIARRWADISDAGHVGVFAGAALLFLVIGAVLFQATDPALQRLVGVLWCLSVAGLAGAVGVAVHDGSHRSAQLTALIVGLSMSGYSGALWLLRRQELQNLAVFVSLIVTICGTVTTIAHGDAPSLAFAVPLWAFGLGWVLLGWRRWVEPMWLTIALGLLLSLLAPSFGVAEHGWVYAIAVGTTVGVMAASVPLRNTPMLAMGTVGLFGYLTSLVIRYFADSLGPPTALALTGALILVLAAVGTRLARMMRKPEPEPERSAVAKSAGQPPSGRHLSKAS